MTPEEWAGRGRVVCANRLPQNIKIQDPATQGVTAMSHTVEVRRTVITTVHYEIEADDLATAKRIAEDYEGGRVADAATASKILTRSVPKSVTKIQTLPRIRAERETPVTRRNRATGASVTTHHVLDEGVLPWFVTCDTHGTRVDVKTNTEARIHQAGSWTWCEECRKAAEQYDKRRRVVVS